MTRRHDRGMRACPLSFVILLAILAGCLPIPNVRLELNLPPPDYRLPPSAVRTDYVTLPGFAEPHTPAEYNKALYLRYYDPSQPTSTVLVLVPGIFGGATSLDILARQLVAATRGLEVWAVDRRANLLEDRSAMVRSLRRRDPAIAYDYYLTQAGTEEGFNPVPPDALRFMGFWGLEVHLHDLHEIVKRAEEAASTVVLGGHSLGASLVSFYAAYAFDDGPGYRHIDGLVLIDGALGRTGGFDFAEGGLGIGPIEVVPSVAELEAGEGSPYLRLGLTPRYYARSETAALLAKLAPEALSPGGFVDFPATNQAVMGLYADDEYGAAPLFGVSIGEAVGADLAGNLTAVLLTGLEGVYSKSIAGVAEGFEALSWTEEGVREYTDPVTYAGAWTQLETNRNEWYFPLRLLQDMSQMDIVLKRHPAFVPNAEVTTPTLAVGAERGLIDSLDGFATYANVRPGAFFSSYILPGFTHIDIVSARDNPVVPLFQHWLRQLR